MASKIHKKCSKLELLILSKKLLKILSSIDFLKCNFFKLNLPIIRIVFMSSESSKKDV